MDQQVFFPTVTLAPNQHEGFLKDHLTLKTGVMAAENSALLLQEYITFKKFKDKLFVFNFTGFFIKSICRQ